MVPTQKQPPQYQGGQLPSGLAGAQGLQLPTIKAEVPAAPLPSDFARAQTVLGDALPSMAPPEGVRPREISYPEHVMPELQEDALRRMAAIKSIHAATATRAPTWFEVYKGHSGPVENAGADMSSALSLANMPLQTAQQHVAEQNQDRSLYNQFLSARAHEEERYASILAAERATPEARAEAARLKGKQAEADRKSKEKIAEGNNAATVEAAKQRAGVAGARLTLVAGKAEQSLVDKIEKKWDADRAGKATAFGGNANVLFRGQRALAAFTDGSKLTPEQVHTLQVDLSNMVSGSNSTAQGIIRQNTPPDKQNDLGRIVEWFTSKPYAPDRAEWAAFIKRNVNAEMARADDALRGNRLTNAELVKQLANMSQAGTDAARRLVINHGLHTPHAAGRINPNTLEVEGGLTGNSQQPSAPMPTKPAGQPARRRTYNPATGRVE